LGFTQRKNPNEHITISQNPGYDPDFFMNCIIAWLFKITFVQKALMYKSLLLILLSSLECMESFSSQISVSGNVSGSWNVDTVIVTDNILVANGQVLYIFPGTRVEFQGHYRFRVDGQLLALGMEADTIIFTVNDTTGFSNLHTDDGAWNGLWFYHLSPVNDSSVFEYCKFEFGKAALDADSTNWYGGAACVKEFDRLRFSNCRFVNNRAYKNGGAIYAKDATFKIELSTFENNFCGQPTLYGYGGGICLEYSNAVIYRNYFINNRSTGVGGGLSFEYSDPQIESNHFYDNYSAIGGGFVCLRSNGTRPIVNNLVEGNSSLFFGGGIAMIETTKPFTNNTVVANFSGAGGGLYFNSSSFPVFKNCVVWDNYDQGSGGPQVYIWDTFSAPEFYYCDLEGGAEQFGGTGGGGGFIGVYVNCYEIDPLFTGSGQHPYQPLQNSICINNGTPDTTGLFLPEYDFGGNNRIMNYYIDIGAYETLVITSEEELFSQNDVTNVFPNPFRSEVNITFTFKEPQNIIIWIVNTKGQVVEELENSFLTSGSYQYDWSPGDNQGINCSTGIYYLKIKKDKIVETKKIICIK
jgi:predicted outer membrane repeat protein